MSALEGFRIFNFSEGVPYISVTSNGVNFNKAVIMKLGYPEHVVLLVDDATKRIAIQVCGEDTPNAVAFYKPKKNHALSVRWNGRDLLTTICGLMGWNLRMESYKIDGVLLREENAMLFDLNSAEKMS